MIIFNKKNPQAGRSMIEMLGVLAIVGILSAGAISGYSMAMAQYKSNLLIEKVQLIVSRARSIYKSGDYTGISNQNLIDSGKLSAKDLENPFGGNLTVEKGSRNFGSTNGTIVYSSLIKITSDTNIPKGTCVDILTTDWGNDAVYISAAGSGYFSSSFPETLHSAINKCKTREGQELKMELDFL
jgi:prepilin-type N-terminal cleavage/methylation domain-containing protein